jgi:Trp operon repressor
MEHQELQVQWRRDKVQELCSEGHSQREISYVLQVGLATINRNISYLRNQAKTNIIDTLMKGCQKSMRCLAGLNSILKEAWTVPDRQQYKE